MIEKEELKIKLYNHIIYNVIAFLSIFIVFGLVVFGMVKTNVYSGVNNELYESRRKILDLENIEVDFSFNGKMFRGPIKDVFQQENINVYNITSKIVNPNIIVVVRDLEGTIINEDLGRLSEYSDEISFDSKNLDQI